MPADKIIDRYVILIVKYTIRHTPITAVFYIAVQSFQMYLTQLI